MELMPTEQEYRKLAAEADRAARRKGLSQEQREHRLQKASRFRSLARRAAGLASQPTEQQFHELAADMDLAARHRGLCQAEREHFLARASHFRLLARRAAERAQESLTMEQRMLHVVEP
jgi:hypothetical protein